MDVVLLIGIAAGVISLWVNARQLGLQTAAVRLQTIALEEDRKERTAQREQRRTILLAALQAELRPILSAAEADYSEYRAENLSSSRVAQEGSSLAVEGDIRHPAGFRMDAAARRYDQTSDQRGRALGPDVSAD